MILRDGKTSTAMTRREFYRRILDLVLIAGSGGALLDAAAEQMVRVRRGEKKTCDWFDGLDGLLKADDALGRIYQAINSPALESAYRATARTGRKFSDEEIPAVTQLFTTRWVVEFLLHNTLGKLWREMHPKSALRFKWLVESDKSGQQARPISEIRICDPACGTMNFGLVALDMLREMYREEGYSDPAEIDRSIVQNNLFGFDIDATAIVLGRKSLEIKTGLRIENDQLRLADALFDVDRDGQFDIVATNPPYLSARNLDPKRIARIKKDYPAGWRDAYACFILKSLHLLRPAGRAGILCMHSFMFTGAFEKLRGQILDAGMVESAAHFGPGLFDVGNPGTLQTVAFCLHKSISSGRGVFFRLVDDGEKEKTLRSALAGENSLVRFEVSTEDLRQSPRGAWMYWSTGAVRRAFQNLKPLGEIAPPRQGLATTDNLCFVRYWWEVEPPGFTGPRARWVPYAKGGRFCRWYESARHRVDWEDDGRRIKLAIVSRYPYLNGEWSWVAKNSDWYGRAGITYSYLTSGQFSARLLEEGTFFDVAGSSLFPDDRLSILGILNSSAARRLLGAINPTVNFQVGDLRLLPIPHDMPQELGSYVAQAVELSRRWDRGDETSSEFTAPLADFEAREIASGLAEAERQIDRIVSQLYGMDREPADSKSLDIDPDELDRRRLSHALGRYLGRWGGRKIKDWVCLWPLDADLENFVRAFAADSKLDVKKFFAREFSAWHNRTYRGRPVFWAMGGDGRIVATDGSDTNRQIIAQMLDSIDGRLPLNWDRRRDEPIHLNLAPLADWIVDSKLRGALQKAAREHAIRKELNCESALR
jgi:hypothetical protein